jgi:hypothetical protein
MGDKVTIPMKSKYQDRDHQVGAIDYLVNFNEPMRGLAAQTGCIVGSSNVDFTQIDNNFSMSIKEAHDRFNRIATNDNWNRDLTTHIRALVNGRIQLHPIEGIVYSGKRLVFKLTLMNNRYILATPNHEIMTNCGMVELCKLTDEEVVCDQLEDPYGNPTYSPVKSITEFGIEDTYDIICKYPHYNFVANGIVIHNSGKSYSSIKAISLIGRRALVLVEGLTKQWIDDIYEYTELREGEVYLIQGHQSIAALSKNIPYPTPKIYVASISTIRNYVIGNSPLYSKFKQFNIFLDYLGIGVKVIDECHLNFATNTTIDMNCNVRHNLYLSATYTRSDSDGKRIFEIVFPPHMRYGESDYKKYVDIYSYTYYIGYIAEKAVITQRGYNQYNFEKYLLKRKSLLSSYYEKIGMLFESHYLNIKNPNEKLLIIVGTKNLANSLLKYLNDKYKKYKLKMAIYFSETEDEVLDNSDVIISTLGSCGTGRDISRLRSAIVTNSFSSFGANKQALGRLRELPNIVPEFATMANSAISSHMLHKEERKKIFSQLGRRYIELDL